MVPSLNVPLPLRFENTVSFSYEADCRAKRTKGAPKSSPPFSIIEILRIIEVWGLPRIWMLIGCSVKLGKMFSIALRVVKDVECSKRFLLLTRMDA